MGSSRAEALRAELEKVEAEERIVNQVQAARAAYRSNPNEATKAEMKARVAELDALRTAARKAVAEHRDAVVRPAPIGTATATPTPGVKS